MPTTKTVVKKPIKAAAKKPVKSVKRANKKPLSVPNYKLTKRDLLLHINIHPYHKYQNLPFLLSAVDRLLKLDELAHPDIRMYIDQNDIPMSNAVEVIKLPKDLQPEWLDRAIEDHPADFIPACMAQVKLLKKNKR